MHPKHIALIIPLALAACNSTGDSNLDFAETVRKMEGPKVATMQDAQLQEAKAASQAGNYSKAIGGYNQLVATYPDNMTYLLGLADSQRLSGNLTAARETYKKVLANPKKDTKATLDATEGNGLCYMQEGNFVEAVKTFSEVLAQDASRWRTVNALGVALALTGRSKEAMDYYNSALQLSDNNPAVLNNMALTLAFSGQTHEAIAPLQQAYNALPKEAVERKQVALNLALVYGLNGQMTDAERMAKPYLSEAALYNNMGVYAMLANNKQQAQDYLKKALSSSPAHYQKAWDNLQKVGG